VHHSGPGPGAPPALSPGGLRHDAGLLAAGAPTAPQHQRHSEDVAHHDESHAGLPGHTGIGMEYEGKESDAFWVGLDLHWNRNQETGSEVNGLPWRGTLAS